MFDWYLNFTIQHHFGFVELTLIVVFYIVYFIFLQAWAKSFLGNKNDIPSQFSKPHQILRLFLLLLVLTIILLPPKHLSSVISYKNIGVSSPNLGNNLEIFFPTYEYLTELAAATKVFFLPPRGRDGNVQSSCLVKERIPATTLSGK